MSEILPLEISVKHAPYFNYTFCLNKYSFLQEIQLKNLVENLSNVKVEISSSLGIFDVCELHFDLLKKEAIFSIHEFDFKYNLTLIKNLTEKDLDRISVIFFSDELAISSTSFSLEVLPMDHFGGLQVLPQLLTSYVTPNNEEWIVILGDDDVFDRNVVEEFYKQFPLFTKQFKTRK